MKKTKQIRLMVMALGMTALTATAQTGWNNKGKDLLRETNPEFFQTDEARRIGQQVLLYQRVTGGWPKNIDMARPLTDEERARVASEKNRRNDSTTDNKATTTQMVYLARLFQATGDTLYSQAFCRGVDYLLSGQYDNGGWPQFWPEMRDYQIHITYNDNAMVNTMRLLRDIIRQKTPFQGQLTDEPLRQRAQQAFDKGVECILRTQIKTGGELTVWCQQHDRETFLPASARAYELPSYCSQETAGIVKLLMQLPHPNDSVKQAIHAAMAWLDKYKLTGLKLMRKGIKGQPDANTWLERDSTARPLWARYYGLADGEPYVCDRDGVPRRRLEDIGIERRNGYSWFNSEPAELYPLYEKWADKHDPAHKIAISLNTKGANENGLLKEFPY